MNLYRKLIIPGVIRRYDGTWGRNWRQYNNYSADWDYDEYFDWKPNVDYIMLENGELKSPDELLESIENSHIGKDSLRIIQLEQKKLRDSVDRELKKTEQELKQKRKPIKDANSDGDESTTLLELPQLFFTRYMHLSWLKLAVPLLRNATWGSLWSLFLLFASSAFSYFCNPKNHA